MGIGACGDGIMEPTQRTAGAAKSRTNNHRLVAHARRRRWFGVAWLGATRVARAAGAWAARAWGSRRPAQQLALGFAFYAVVGTSLLCLPVSQERPAGVLDHAFNVVSAVSTTGLTTASVPDTYTTFGEAVLLVLFQLGGIGFMTLSSMFILARGGSLSDGRLRVLQAGFSLPLYFKLPHFVRQVVVYTFACETVGALLLWMRFHALGQERAAWSAVFHSVSAFTTAGFSLHNDNLERYADDLGVNLIVGTLCILGSVGFIVAQDVWYTVKLRERMLTFTSKVILTMTGVILVAGTAGLYFADESLRSLPPASRLLASAFQAMTASTTAGFNTVPIGAMSRAALALMALAMVVGASPSGTGGGIKTTGVSALLGNLFSVLRGRAVVTWMGHEIPAHRVQFAVANATVYFLGIALGVLALCATESHDFLPVLFESVSAIGTVGLSMGITPNLSVPGKLVIIALMFAGRCGPLTIGLALMSPRAPQGSLLRDDLAV